MRRIADKPTISAHDANEVLAMVVAEHGGAPAPVAPRPLVLEDLPIPSASAALELVSVSELLNVNGLAENQLLAFGPRLNVVYGATGTGKSSYTRIFKRACRTVDDEAVLRNIYTVDATPPQATITIKTAAGTEALRVDLAGTGPAALSSVMVFDGRCATLYATNETVAFTPMTLRVFDRLAASQISLRDCIDERIAALSPAPSFADLQVGTTARRLVDEMTADTDIATIESLAELDGTATARLADLEVQLARLKQSGPDALAARAEREANAFAVLASRIEHLMQAIGTEPAARVASGRAAVTATAAAVDAAAAAFAAEPLRATGTPGWLLMWNAARRFLEHDCGATFPPPQGAVCPFCQQLIGADAGDRVARLEQFVKSAVERDAEQARAALEGKLAALRALDVEGLADLAGMGFLEVEEPDVHAAVLAFIEMARVRAKAIVDGNNAEVPTAPVDRLTMFVSARRAYAASQRELVDPEHQHALTVERDELRARQLLAARLPDVRGWYQRQGERALLLRARQSLDTSTITRKHTELAKVAVSDALCRRVREELDAFGFEDLKIEVASRGQKGQTKLRAALAACDENPDRVLSTGEARGVSLAFFLAELACSDDTGPIVVDDPTSSFDQAHRRHFAHRLVDESRRRQVVVLTHDVALLYELETYAEKIGLACNSQALRKVSGRPGITDPDLPWAATGVKGRRGVLNARLQKLEKLHRLGDSEYDDQARLTAELLRETWERSIEERVLNGALTRFEPAVQTRRLTNSAVDPDIVRRIEEGMTEASQWVHDTPRGGHAPVPTPKELKEAFQHFDEFLAELPS
jgi:energy-coupling factor transporter ATP-binding protein EcfA2